MIGYYLELAWHNLRRSPWLTALIILTIAVGIGASMTTCSLLRAMSRDPMPQKSAQLFAPVAAPRKCDKGAACLLLGWPQAMELWQTGKARRQAVMFPTRYIAGTEPGGSHSPEVRALATHADLFAMFDLRFRKGGPWSAADDAAGARVTVLSASLAERFFPHGDAMDRVIFLDGLAYRVVGVVADWSPQPHFHIPLYKQEAPGFHAADELFVPIAAAVAQPGRPMLTTGRFLCGGGFAAMADRNGWLGGGCTWVQLWVELEGADAVRRYRDHLPPGWRLLRVQDFLAQYEIVPRGYWMQAMAGVAFLVVCLVNVIGLMLARFHARGEELRLRRALGASRGALFRQCLTETAMLGVTGGALGLPLVFGGMALQRQVLPAGLNHVTAIDATIIVATVLLALAGTLCAGLYPAWRASRATNLVRLPGSSRHRFGAALVVAQIGLTLGILSNTLPVVWQHVEEMQVESGLDDREVFTFSTTWNGRPEEFKALAEKDVATLRAIPEVLDATYSQNVPDMSEGHSMIGRPAEGLSAARSVQGMWALSLRVDSHGLNSFGARLLAGRGFESDRMPQVVISKVAADTLFPEGHAVGKQIYVLEDLHTVIGVFDYWRPAMFLTGSDRRKGWLSLDGRAFLVVRARPHQLGAAMRKAVPLLRRLDPLRSYSEPVTFTNIRTERMRGISGTVVALLGLCALLILVVAFGISGLTWYWAQQRQRSIVIRRALGARRAHIRLRFHAENLVMVATGVAAGVVIALAGNAWLVRYHSGPELALLPVLIGAALILLLSQLAVFWPALKAALIPPAAAGRSG